MSTNSRPNPLSPSPSSIIKRKQSHIETCREMESEIIGNSGAGCGFESLQFIHNALPEVSLDSVSTETVFLGKPIKLPLFISCMTGGTDEGLKANHELAKAAQKMRIPFGLGSVRVLLSQPERMRDFALRSLAPDIPILGNIGAVQVRDTPLNEIADLLRRLEVDALVIHLNTGQELFQSGGDTDFRGLKAAIGKSVEAFRLPIIVKETGFGIRPRLVMELFEMGVDYVDLAGSGGTNWILVENASDQISCSAASEFASWGNATAVLLDSVREFKGKILSSGGLRSGMDLAKSLALGAVAGGMALPFIKAALNGGEDAVCLKIMQIEKVLKTVMMMTGCATIAELQRTPILKSAEFLHQVSSLIAIDLK